MKSKGTKNSNGNRVFLILVDEEPSGKAPIPRWVYAAVPLVLLLMVLAGVLLARGSAEFDEVTPLPATAVVTILSPGIQTPPPDQAVIPTVKPITPAELTPTNGPPFVLLAPASELVIAGDETVLFDWQYPVPLASGQQFSVQMMTESGPQTLGVVTRPVSDQQYRLIVQLDEWELSPGVHQWFVALETIADGEELGRSELQPLVIQAVTPTATPTLTLTATMASGVSQPTESPIAACTPAPPANWVMYIVQEGDYLFNLAIDTGTTVARIEEVNCLTATALGVGQRLWLPLLPPTLTPTLTATTTPTTTATSTGDAPGSNTPEFTRTPPPP